MPGQILYRLTGRRKQNQPGQPYIAATTGLDAIILEVTCARLTSPPHPPIIGPSDARRCEKGVMKATMARPSRSPLAGALGRIEVATWRAINSAYMHMALLATLLIFVLLGGLLPQVTPDIAPSSRYYQEWRGQLRAPWGAAADVLERLGLFQIFQSWPFHFTMAIVAIVAILRLLSLWIPPWVPPPPYKVSVRHVILPYDEAGKETTILIALKSVGLRVVRQLSYAGFKYAAAQRVGLARYAPGLVYLGILTLLLASLIESRFGWAGPRLDLALGETCPLGNESGLAVRLEQIDLLPWPDGTWRRFDSHLSLIQNAGVVRQFVLGLNRRATYQGLSVYQLGFGPAVRVSAQKEPGQSLKIQQMVGKMPAQHALRLRFSGRQQEQSLTIPDADLIVRLVYYPSFPPASSSERMLHVQLLRGSTGEIEAEQFLAENGQMRAGDVKVNIAFEYSVTLRAEREPGLPLAAFGGGLVLLGLVGHFLWPPRELWIIIYPEAQRCVGQLIVSQHEANSPWFRTLTAHLAGETHG